MPRPCKQRRVRGNPNSFYFKPAGIRGKDLLEIIMTKEEFEAIRLKDFLNLEQNECANQMEISQPTFHRLLVNSRKKIAEALVEGKAIRID